MATQAAYDHTASLPGLVVCHGPNVASTVATLTMTASEARCGRIYPSRAMTIASIAFEVTTAAAGNVDVGIYRGSDMALLASSGSTAGKLGATGIQTVSLSAPYTLSPGTPYYLAIVADSTPTLRCVSLGGNPFNNIFGAANPNAYIGTRAAAGIPLPATLGAAWGSAFTFLLAARES